MCPPPPKILGTPLARSIPYTSGFTSDTFVVRLSFVFFTTGGGIPVLIRILVLLIFLMIRQVCIKEQFFLEVRVTRKTISTGIGSRPSVPQSFSCVLNSTSTVPVRCCCKSRQLDLNFSRNPYFSIRVNLV